MPTVSPVFLRRDGSQSSGPRLISIPGDKRAGRLPFPRPHGPLPPSSHHLHIYLLKSSLP